MGDQSTEVSVYGGRVVVERPSDLPTALVFLHKYDGQGLGRATSTLNREQARTLGQALLDLAGPA